MLTLAAIAMLGLASGLRDDGLDTRADVVELDVTTELSSGECEASSVDVWLELCDADGLCSTEEVSAGGRLVVDVDASIVTVNVVSSVLRWEFGGLVADSFVDTFDVEQLSSSQEVWQVLQVDRCEFEHRLELFTP